MRFTKMQGLGNDYIYVNCIDALPPDPAPLARRLSDRNFGIGADGLILIGPSDQADFFMHMYNADGSQSEMCGNGIRCVGKFVYDKGLTDKTELAIDTLAGVKYLSLNMAGGEVETVTVDMGEPILSPPLIPMDAEGENFIGRLIQVGREKYSVTCVSMGNPHAVTFAEDIDGLDLTSLGPKFENHVLFPKRTNTEFVHVIDRSTLQMRVWERGSGETLACGTGACASAVAASLLGLCGDEVTVRLRGGELKILWDKASGRVKMTGPAVTVFEGEIN